MLLKIIGSIMIILSSSFIGYVLSRDCSRRPREIRELQGLLQMLENEISYLSSYISDAFERICKASTADVTIFFKDTASSLRKDDSLNASEAWERAVTRNIKRTSLSKEDEGILISFGKMLGNSDIEGQIKNIGLALSQLKNQEQKAEEARAKSEKMFKSLGILGGLAVVVILI
jgi:stage III sporulation protein AB